jgi:serine phosphatase RsbU (regulator of sigma subunit)
MLKESRTGVYMLSLRSWSRWIVFVTIALLILCIGLLIDDELRITAISADLDQADDWLVSAFLRTKRTLRISVAIESLLVIGLVAITLRGLSTLVREPLRQLRSDLRDSAKRHDHIITTQGPREIVDVAVDAESLRRALVAQIDIATQSTQALTLEAPATSALRRALDREHDHVDGIAGYCRPIEGVIAGDWWWAAQRKDGSRMVALADISGHGVQAGVMAVESRAIVATALASSVPLVEIAQGLARHQWESGMFLTLFMAVLQSDELEYCSAGAPFAGLISAQGFELLPTTGPAISNLRGLWVSQKRSLEAEHVLISATDGLVDALSEESLAAEVQRATALNVGDPDALLATLLNAVRQTDTDWIDDVTVILATRNSRGEFQ